MASLQVGPGALTTPTTGTGQNPIDLSTHGSASQEHQRRQEERTKRKADESESESDNSEEEEEESPISLKFSILKKRSTRVPIPPLIWANRKRPRTRSTGPLPGRRLERSPPAPNARQSGSRSRAVVIGLIKGKEVRSA